jgi:hypothetical protein
VPISGDCGLAATPVFWTIRVTRASPILSMPLFERLMMTYLLAEGYRRLRRLPGQCRLNRRRDRSRPLTSRLAIKLSVPWRAELGIGPMDSVDLYLQLLESGEGVVKAVAEERKIRASSPNSSRARCRDPLGAARHAVERAAQSYATALRSYRMAILSEWAPCESARAKQPAFSATYRIPARIGRSRIATSCRSRRGRATEAFPAPAGLSKIPS